MSDSFCVQDANRKRNLLFAVPPTRYTPVSPYVQGGPTQYQLDMRRKAEILQYKNKDAGSITKKQQWSQIARGTVQRRNKSQASLAETSYDCPFTPTISTNAGIPGKPFTIFLDPAVELYNYTTTRTYATENAEDPALWVYEAATNIANNIANVITFNVRPTINQLNYMFSITTPIALDITGTSRYQSGALDVSGTFTVELTISDINIEVKYGGQTARIMTVPQPAFSTGFLTTVSGTTTFPATSDVQFHGVLYMGNLTINNIRLPTSPGYTYDVIFKYIQSNTYDTDTFVSTIISNYSGPISPAPTNMRFTQTAPSTIIPEIVFSGV